MVDSRTVGLTFNDNTSYTWIYVNLKDGPLVLKVPPMVLGAINDMWYRWGVDLGITGPDHGKGGKYLLLPSGYHVVNSQTFNLWVPWRIFMEHGEAGPGVEQTKKLTKIYPLADAGKPAPELKAVNLSGKPFNLVPPRRTTRSGKCSIRSCRKSRRNRSTRSGRASTPPAASNTASRSRRMRA